MVTCCKVVLTSCPLQAPTASLGQDVQTSPVPATNALHQPNLAAHVVNIQMTETAGGQVAVPADPSNQPPPLHGVLRAPWSAWFHSSAMVKLSDGRLVQKSLGLYPSAEAAADAHDLAVLVVGNGDQSVLNKDAKHFSGHEVLKHLAPEEFVAKLVSYSKLQSMRVPRTKGVIMAPNHQFEAQTPPPCTLPSTRARVTVRKPAVEDAFDGTMTNSKRGNAASRALVQMQGDSEETDRCAVACLLPAMCSACMHMWLLLHRLMCLYYSPCHITPTRS
jgi:hypothetical protein